MQAKRELKIYKRVKSHLAINLAKTKPKVDESKQKLSQMSINRSKNQVDTSAIINSEVDKRAKNQSKVDKSKTKSKVDEFEQKPVEKSN